jgi:hypothetical protein
MGLTGLPDTGKSISEVCREFRVERNLVQMEEKI